MNWTEILRIAGSVVVLGVAFGAGIGGFWYAFKSKDNKLLKEQNRILMEQNTATRAALDRCEEQHNESKAESKAAIANLQGQIDVLKNIPLVDISANMKKLAESNDAIYNTLSKSAVIAATDRDALMGTAHIAQQHVDHQTVEKETIQEKG